MDFKAIFRKSIMECAGLGGMIGGGLIIGTILMIMLYSLPTGRIYQNAGESVPLYSTQMTDNWSGSAPYTELSNFTESIMINNALYRPYEDNVENAMMNSYIYFDDLGVVQSLVKFLADGPTGGVKVDYSRYWHGYLIYLIPGLAFFTVGELKVLMMIVQTLLFSLCLYEFGKRDFLYVILFAFVVMFINPVTTVLTFQDADIYMIMLVFTFLFLKAGKWLRQKERWKFIFALNGIMVSFIDFFTYPLVAFGIPMLTFLLVEESRGKKAVAMIMKSLFFWSSGYAGMWIGKWIIALLLTGNNTIAEGMDSVKFRTTGAFSDEELTYRYVLHCMWDAVNDSPMWILFILSLMVAGVYIWKGKYSLSLKRESISVMIPIFIVGMLPFAYYFVVRNHSAIHPWLEYRELAVTLFGAGILGIRLLSPGRKEDLVQEGSGTQ